MNRNKRLGYLMFKMRIKEKLAIKNLINKIKYKKKINIYYY